MSHIHYFQCDSCGKRYKPYEVLANESRGEYKDDSPLHRERVPVTRRTESGKCWPERRILDLCDECWQKFYTVTDNFFAHIEVTDDQEIHVYPCPKILKVQVNNG